MVEKKHSFAGRQMSPEIAPRIAPGTTRVVPRHRYLRRLGPITGKGCRLSVLLLLAVSLLIRSSSNPCQAAVDVAAVQRAIDRGITYLRKTQNERGGWEEYGGQSCGLSALCTLALLNAGVPKDDPDIVDAMRYLRSFEPSETYSVALQTQVYCQLGAAGDLWRVRRNVEWLVSNQKRGGTSRDRIGSWDYGSGRGSGDPSNAQFALLALGAARIAASMLIRPYSKLRSTTGFVVSSMEAGRMVAVEEPRAA